MLNPQAHGIPHILVIGRRMQWPGPLAQLLADGSLGHQCVTDLHQAAALLARPHGAYRAILIDPDHLSRREISLLSVIKRHVALPIWSLPSARNRKDMLAQLGIVPWEDAVRALAQLLHSGSTPQIPQGSSTIPQFTFSSPAAVPQGTPSPPYHPLPIPPTPADNGPQNDPEKHTEIPVASEVAARYDALDGQLLLSEPEIRALLGAPE